MSALRSELMSVLNTLLTVSETTLHVELDAIGAAIGALSVSTDDIDALLRELEARGRQIVAPSGGGAERQLGQVVAAARKLRISSPQGKPGLSEVAREAGLSEDQVLVALALLRVMQRSPRDVKRS
jgi:hypothetical protein